MLVSQTKEIIQILLLRVHQHGRRDVKLAVHIFASPCNILYILPDFCEGVLLKYLRITPFLMNNMWWTRSFLLYSHWEGFRNCRVGIRAWVGVRTESSLTYLHALTFVLRLGWRLFFRISRRVIFWKYGKHKKKQLMITTWLRVGYWMWVVCLQTHSRVCDIMNKKFEHFWVHFVAS